MRSGATSFHLRSDSGGPIHASEREDGGVLISGRLTLTSRGQSFALSAGGSFQFAGCEYAWQNLHDEAADCHLGRITAGLLIDCIYT
ncbi:MAG: hypothetical protein KGH84_09880 [Paracoccaceae bacterium]|nr:hypothetical protein [Paracoccaceae bacterium]